MPLFEYAESIKRGLLFVVSVSLAAIFSMDCCAQERDPSQMTREEWRAEVQAGRERLELMRRQHRSFIPQEPSQDEIAESASKRVLEDDSLQSGDIVSTTHGLYRFRGRRMDNGRQTILCAFAERLVSMLAQ